MSTAVRALRKQVHDLVAFEIDEDGSTTTATVLRNALLLGVEHHGARTDAEHHRHPLVVDLHPFHERPNYLRVGHK